MRGLTLLGPSLQPARPLEEDSKATRAKVYVRDKDEVVESKHRHLNPPSQYLILCLPPSHQKLRLDGADLLLQAPNPKYLTISYVKRPLSNYTRESVKNLVRTPSLSRLNSACFAHHKLKVGQRSLHYGPVGNTGASEFFEMIWLRNSLGSHAETRRS